MENTTTVTGAQPLTAMPVIPVRSCTSSGHSAPELTGSAVWIGAAVPTSAAAQAGAVDGVVLRKRHLAFTAVRTTGGVRPVATGGALRLRTSGERAYFSAPSSGTPTLSPPV